MTEFEGVVPALGKALAKRGYETLTPVQQSVIAAEMRDADALVSAQTGSGKTVAFGLAMASTLLGDAERFERVSSPIALAVAPTRELALQVKRELEWLYEFTGASVVSCVGGMDMRTERMALQRGAHIVVGTPGRLRDHVERRSLDMSDMKVIVLDEADEMLDLGFREDLEFILKAAPESRRTLMFSATVPRTIASLAKRYQKDAVRISTAGEKNQHVDIEYRALACAPNDRENAIINVLRHSDAVTTIVFCSTRATVNHLTSRFTNRGISVVALSGELSQSARTHALQALRDGRAQVCVATDVAARGIDLPNLELVIHADLPKNQESLLHRSGRTGRAGRKGVSTLIVPYSKRRQTERMLSNANIKATWGKPPSVDEILALDRKRILEDADLSGETTEEERTFAAELLSRHDAEAVAIAFLRKRMAGLPAPEELMNDPSGGERYERGDRGDRGDRGGRGERGERGEPRNRRNDFEDGVWIRLSVGRNHKAEARWLLPMLCRTGDLTKSDVGAIKIQETETHVELHPKAVDKFLAAVGPSRKVEKSITVDRMASAPSEASSAPEPRAPRKPRESAPRKPRAEGESSSRAPRPPRGEAEQGGYPPKRRRDMGEDQARPARDAVTQSVDTAPIPTPEPSSRPDAGTAPDRKLKKPRKPKDGDAKAGAKFGKPKLGKPKFDKPKSASADGKPGKPGKPAKGKPQSKPGSGPKKPHRKGVNKPKAPWVD
ncbi:DEAD/DEAH box helicase [Nisaea sp.]|uniref:DEAD/DEAH box helicase n=1 Tax=Nisaea sp. TaxID=2024842 RepID=UPI002B273639|nr:DEAD/DEAH box helicase [Nisaea sp.]